MSNYYNKSIENKNGKIYFYVTTNYGYRRLTSSADLAEAMTMADMAKILDACGGDFSLLEENTAQAISIKATLILEKQEENAKRQAEVQRLRSEAHHKAIIQEIRDLVGDKSFFTVTDIQTAARNAGYIVRSRQMYSCHMIREVWRSDEEHTMEHVFQDAEYIEVILRNGKVSRQRISPTKSGYRFKK